MRLRLYLRLLERRDAALGAAWPRRVLPWSRSRGVSLRDVERLLDEHAPSLRGHDLLLHYLLSRYPPRRGTGGPRLLELGSRYGLFLDLLRGLGYRHAAGIDVDARCVRLAAARGLDVTRLDAARMPTRHGAARLDAVFAMRLFTVELDDPALFAKPRDWVVAVTDRVRDCLLPGGVFFCSAEVRLPVSRIAARGLRVKHRVPGTSVHPVTKAVCRDDVWVFEKLS